MVSVVTLAFSLFIEMAGADPTAPVVRRLPDYPNPVQGSCKDLRAAAGAGVKDTEGGVHAGTCGFTQVKFYFDGLEIADYANEVAEQKIKPFTITPYQGAPGMNCARATGIRVELSGSAEVSYLNWLHGKPAGSKCDNEWSRLKKVIVDHEGKHVEDLQPVLNAAQSHLNSVTVSNCVASGSPDEGVLEKGLIELRDSWLAMKKDWDKHAAELDGVGDLCDINCCACSDSSCYSGSFTANTTENSPVFYSGAKGQHVEMSLIREDKDRKGQVLQQFYTLDRGEFVYPPMVAVGEYDCTLDKTTFPLHATEANMTLFLNNPHFQKNSYNLGFFIDGNPIGTCHLRSDPKVTMTMPLYPFNFGMLTDCSQHKTLPFNSPSLIEGGFANTCASSSTTVDWSFKINE